MRRADVAPPGSGPAILAFGDDALLVDLREPASIRAARRSQALARAVATRRLDDPRLGMPVPGAASVLVPFHAAAADADALVALLGSLLEAVPADPPPPPGARTIEVRVRYGGDAGPDLEDAAGLAGMRAGALVELHAAEPYEVLFLGFAPGFAYLGELPATLALPRFATPRTRVPAGSVAIADRFTAIYPQASPGGWRVIGRTELRVFDPAADPAAALRPGDRVRFVPA